MSTPTPDTQAALDFLSRMFDASVPRHLVAIERSWEGCRAIICSDRSRGGARLDRSSPG